MQKSTEQLLTPTDVYKKLRISKSKFYRIRARLLANGVKTIWIDGSLKYLQSSIDALLNGVSGTAGHWSNS